MSSKAEQSLERREGDLKQQGERRNMSIDPSGDWQRKHLLNDL
jgi:hypothetical protein